MSAGETNAVACVSAGPAVLAAVSRLPAASHHVSGTSSLYSPANAWLPVRGAPKVYTAC